MTASGGPIASYRSYWLPELIVLALLFIAAATVFAYTDFDIAASRWFYHPELVYPWPEAYKPLWAVLYASPPWVTGSLAVTGAAMLIAGMMRREARRLRLYGLLIVLTVAIGPGLIINAVLKDHWGRPRPRQITEFGGRHAYAPPLLPAGAHGKSFPCGHCSVGYLYGIGWWGWRRRDLRIASASLAAGVTLGTMLGLGRMAAGGHFLSDAVWAGLIAFGVTHALYYYVLRIPAREDSRSTLYPLLELNPRLRMAAITGAAILGGGIVVGGILASPHYDDLTGAVPLSGLRARPERLEVIVDTLDVELRLGGADQRSIETMGYVHAFGLPINKLRADWEYDERPVPTLRYRVTQKGWFTDIDGVVTMRVPIRGVREIMVLARHGDITVRREAGEREEAREEIALDLRTADGVVTRPPAGPGAQ